MRSVDIKSNAIVYDSDSATVTATARKRKRKRKRIVLSALRLRVRLLYISCILRYTKCVNGWRLEGVLPSKENPMEWRPVSRGATSRSRIPRMDYGGFVGIRCRTPSQSVAVALYRTQS